MVQKTLSQLWNETPMFTPKGKLSHEKKALIRRAIRADKRTQKANFLIGGKNFCRSPIHPDFNGQFCACVACRGFESCLGACYKCEGPVGKLCGLISR